MSEVTLYSAFMFYYFWPSKGTIVSGVGEIGISLPINQRQHRTLHIRIVLVTVARVSRSCEHFPDRFDLHLLQGLRLTIFGPRVAPSFPNRRLS